MYRNEYYLEKMLQHQQIKLQQVDTHHLKKTARDHQHVLAARLGEWMVMVGTELQGGEAPCPDVTRSRVGA
ncbi:MAG: hypothetical protein JXJ17_05070 [Anaerolineae bacterium]|nr:hypothetical protein [Anaerolineae bacterium]